jgi:hypothetical protein
LGVGSALTLTPNPTLHPKPTLRMFLPIYSRNTQKSVKKQLCRAYLGEKRANRIFILYLCTLKGVTL